MTLSVVELRTTAQYMMAERRRFLTLRDPATRLSLLVILCQISLLVVVAVQQTVAIERLFRDVIAVAEDYPGCCHLYDGMISNMGILLWWSAAVVCGFSALVLAGRAHAVRPVLAFFSAAALSGWLALDDLFMLHEGVFQAAGIPQAATYLLYGVLVVGYLSLCRKFVLSVAPILASLAMGMLGASAAVDVLADNQLGFLSTWLHDHARMALLLDDGFKFIGIGCWFGLHLVAASRAVTRYATIDESRSGDH